MAKRNGTKHRKKSVDEVYEDIHRPQNANKIRTRAPDLDLPALGEFYCVACARYFINKEVLEKHTQTKPHKKRVKILNSEVPYGLDVEEVYGKKIDNGNQASEKMDGDENKGKGKPPRITTESVISVTPEFF